MASNVGFEVEFSAEEEDPGSVVFEDTETVSGGLERLDATVETFGDAALIRADTADRWGNLTFRHAQLNFGPAMATAAKLVVAEVRAFSETAIPPEQVQLSGVYVDRIFVAGVAG